MPKLQSDGLEAGRKERDGGDEGEQCGGRRGAGRRYLDALVVVPIALDADAEECCCRQESLSGEQLEQLQHSGHGHGMRCAAECSDE